MPEMKAMEFTDKLNLQPVTRPVPEPKAGEILIQVYATAGPPTEKLWYTTSHYADGSTRSNDPRARILRHRCRVSNPS
jgi:NADPH:quinone reductase-like Zn-dependent oxidoreductase